MESLKLMKKYLENQTEKIVYDLFNDDYEGFDLSIGGVSFKSRRAHKTPTKQGYFLAMWIKNDMNSNIPYSFESFPRYLIVNVIDGDKMGVFVFSKEILLNKGILSSDASRGKMAFRVYTPSDLNLNKTAEKTKRWQVEVFYDLSSNDDILRLNEIFNRGY